MNQTPEQKARDQIDRMLAQARMASAGDGAGELGRGDRDCAAGISD